MLKRVIIFGAQSYVGLSLCEHLLKEGIEVKGVFFETRSSEEKDLVEERLMFIGRNALLEINDTLYRQSEEDCRADLIIYCGEEDSAEDHVLLQESIEVANNLNHSLLYINSYNGETVDEIFFEILGNHSILLLPQLIGPFQPQSNKTNQSIIRYLKNESKEILIENSILYVKDAIEATYHLLGNIESGMIYIFESEIINIEESNLPIKIRKQKNDGKKIQKDIYTIKVESTISIEEGLNEQILYLKKMTEN
ncbi:hypothetical protein [Metabacillus litoralis]|uniref:hypothetical protein n=1 Tax=Metabacillus litoralis TaxID=152268 RepID=UPI001CFD1436|nr:hypothetical protein [Metabacillus litoralis]